MLSIQKSKCFSAGCSKIVRNFCKCSDPYVYSCSKHIKNHRLDSGNHETEFIPLEILKGFEKADALERMDTILKKLLTLKQQSVSASLKTVDYIKKTLKKLIDQVNIIEVNISKLTSRIAANKTIDNEVVASFMKISINNKLIEPDEIIKNLPIDSWFTRCLNFGHIQDEDILMYSKDNDLNLYAIDLIKLKQIIIPNVSNCWCFSAACRLSQDTYFFCGGYYKALSSNFTNIINIKDNSISILPNCSPRRIHSCVFKKNAVYSFGGFDKTYLKSVEKFDFETNTWSALSDLPHNGGRTWSTIINDKILVIGEQFDCTYVFHENKYLQNLIIGNGQYFACENFIVGKERLYECSNLDAILWQEYIISIPSFSYTRLNIAFKRGKHIFLMTFTYELWRIDMELKTAEKLTIPNKYT